MGASLEGIVSIRNHKTKLRLTPYMRNDIFASRKLLEDDQ